MIRDQTPLDFLIPTSTCATWAEHRPNLTEECHIQADNCAPLSDLDGHRPGRAPPMLRRCGERKIEAPVAFGGPPRGIGTGSSNIADGGCRREGCRRRGLQEVASVANLLLTALFWPASFDNPRDNPIRPGFRSSIRADLAAAQQTPLDQLCHGVGSCSPGVRQVWVTHTRPHSLAFRRKLARCCPTCGEVQVGPPEAAEGRLP